MTLADAQLLHAKRSIFQQKTGINKTIFITLITTFGVKPNEHYLSVAQNQLQMDVLFEQV